VKGAIEWLGDLRVDNLADFGVLADTVEVLVAVVMMLGGIYITHRIQVWADKQGEHPGAVNVGLGGGMERYEQRTMRN
jgi:hypothetical protein